MKRILQRIFKRNKEPKRKLDIGLAKELQSTMPGAIEFAKTQDDEGVARINVLLKLEKILSTVEND